MTTLGTQFADALAAKDAARLGDVLHPEVDFRGLTPSRFWEATDAAGVLDILFGSWFEPSDAIDELVLTEAGDVADRQSVRYRLRVHNDEGAFLVEQQAYLAERDGRIGWMRVVCSGFRPE